MPGMTVTIMITKILRLVAKYPTGGMTLIITTKSGNGVQPAGYKGTVELVELMP